VILLSPDPAKPNSIPPDSDDSDVNNVTRVDDVEGVADDSDDEGFVTVKLEGFDRECSSDEAPLVLSMSSLLGSSSASSLELSFQSLSTK